MSLNAGQVPTDNQGIAGQEPEPVTPVAPQDGDNGGSWLDTLPEGAKNEIKSLRAEAAKNRTEAKALKDKLQEIEEDKLKQAQEWEKLAEKRQAKIAELESTMAAQQLEMLKVQVAQEVGIPLELAARLQGDDEKALKKDAKALQELLKTDPPKGAGIGTPGVRSSVVNQVPPTVRGESRKLKTL